MISYWHLLQQNGTSWAAHILISPEYKVLSKTCNKSPELNSVISYWHLPQQNGTSWAAHVLISPEYKVLHWAATNWKHRIQYLLEFWNVLKTWTGCPEALKNIIPKDEGDYAEEEILTLERQLAQFYAQSFFNRFGQAAVILHCVNEGSWIIHTAVGL